MRRTRNKKQTVAQRLDGMQQTLNDIRDLVSPKDYDGPMCAVVEQRGFPWFRVLLLGCALYYVYAFLTESDNDGQDC